MVLLIAAGVGMLLVASRPEAKRQPSLPPVMLVETLTLTRTPTTFSVSTQGEVTPRTETTLISEVNGLIEAVSPSFVSGGFFEQGELLVQVDPRIYHARVKQARASVATARTQVATENALADYALEDWRRLRDLDAEATPAPSDLTLRTPQLAAALATLESAEAALLQAEGDLERTAIRAPYAGMVREKLSDVGQYIKTGDRLAVTFAIDYAEARLPLTQADLQFLDLPQRIGAASVPVTLSAQVAGSEHHWDGAVTRTEGVFDSRTRVLYAVAQVQDPYGIRSPRSEPLRIGTFVNAEIKGREAGPLFVLPRHALHRGAMVWLVNAADELQAAEVRVVRADTEFVYVDQGLNEGDRLCLTPMEEPLPGMRVRTS